MHTVEVVVSGDNGGYDGAEELCFYSWKQRTASERQPSFGGSQLHFAIYNVFYAPLLCKGGMMKRISSLRNGVPAAPPPLPRGHKYCWRCREENPHHSNLVELTYLAFLYFMRFSDAGRTGRC